MGIHHSAHALPSSEMDRYVCPFQYQFVGPLIVALCAWSLPRPIQTGKRLSLLGLAFGVAIKMSQALL